MSWFELAATCLAIFAISWMGIDLTRVGRIAGVWVSNAILLVVMLKHPRRHWLQICVAGSLGNIAADLAVGDSAIAALLLSGANLVEILCVAMPMRFFQIDRDFARPKTLFAFYGLAAGAACFASAGVGAGTLWLFSHAEFMAAALRWYAADALGLTIFVPILMTVRLRSLLRIFSREQIAPTLILIAILAALIALNFVGHGLPFAFLFFPAIILLTFQRGFAGGTLGLGIIGAYLLAPIVLHSPMPALHNLSFQAQTNIVLLLIAALTFSVVLVGAALEERKSLERGLAAAITRAEMSREEAYVARDAAEKASRSKSMFLANMSHELRTPLNAVIGFSEVMNAETFGPLGSPRYVEYTSLIANAGQHLLDLINDILDMSKIEAGKFEIHRERVGLGEMLRECVTLMGDRAAQGRVSLAVETGTAGVWANVDRRAMKQILLNLLSNAVKFTPPGGSVTATLEAQAEVATISVRDTGVGIPANEIARLGNPFVQVRNHAGAAQMGTGLGLALVRSLIELHHGTFKIESTEGAGTTVSIRIPLLPAASLAA